MDAGFAAKRLIAGLALMAAGIPAGAIEKYVTPEGKVIYSDKAVPGAQSIKKIDTAPSEQTEGPSRRDRQNAGMPSAAPGGGTASASDAQLDAALKAIRDASDALDTAKIRLETSREPQENERQGTVSGRSRLKDNYFERIKQLEKGVEDAQERLNEAYRARNNLR